MHGLLRRAASNHNWLHDNVFSRYGSVVAGEDQGTVRIAGHKTDPSAHNTFEDNVFFYGGHDNLDIGGQYNVVRNNVFHNEDAYYEDTTGKAETSRKAGISGTGIFYCRITGTAPAPPFTP